MSKERLEAMIRDGVSIQRAASICGIATDKAKALLGVNSNLIDLPSDETDVKELARLATPAAIHALVEILSSSEYSASARVAAASAIMDRAHGKPAQSIEHSGGVMVTLQSTVRDALIQANKILDLEVCTPTPGVPHDRGQYKYIPEHPDPELSTDF